MEVIRTTLTKRGKGVSDDDPVRIVEQYWTFDGMLLWERDPCAPATITLDDLKKQIDQQIIFYRKAVEQTRSKSARLNAEIYVDAFQHMRKTFFGEPLP